MTDKEILDHLQSVLNERVGFTNRAMDIELGAITITLRPGCSNDIRALFSDQLLDYYGRRVAKSLEG